MRLLRRILFLSVSFTLLSSGALAKQGLSNHKSFEQVKLVNRSDRASTCWGGVVDQLKRMSKDKPFRAALRANGASFVIGQAVVPDRKYEHVATLKKLVMTSNGLVVRSSIGNHVDLGNGQATFIALPKAHYKGSAAVRFSRFGLPFVTERLRPSEWTHLQPDKIRQDAFSFKMALAESEAQRYLADQAARPGVPR